MTDKFTDGDRPLHASSLAGVQRAGLRVEGLHRNAVGAVLHCV
jgi:hypothetical protein